MTASSSSPSPAARQVRRALLALGAGTLAQRIAQLLVLVLIGRALGPERTGQYALGLAAAGILAALASAGVRTIVAREIALAPERAGDWVRAALRARLLIAAVLCLPYLALASTTRDPAFWALCGLAALPAAFDLKGLLDSAARTAREVALETGASLLHLAMVAALLILRPGSELAWLAGAYLLARTVYALGAARCLRALPATGERRSLRGRRRHAGLLAVTQTAHGLLFSGDIWLVQAFGGPAAAGLYAVAQRLALAGAVPAVQMARLLLPHSNRAVKGGDPARTVAVGLRALGYTVLPVLAGGLVLAEGLCGWFGPAFAGAAPALRALLAGTALLSLGFPISQALFARGDLRGYAAPLWLGAGCHAGLLALWVPALGSAGGGLSALTAHGLYLLAGILALRRQLPLRLLAALRPPLLAAAATGLAALAFHRLLPALAPWPGLIAGGVTAAFCLYRFELSRSWRRVGAGLCQASGFGGEIEAGLSANGGKAPPVAMPAQPEEATGPGQSDRPALSRAGSHAGDPRT